MIKLLSTTNKVERLYFMHENKVNELDYKCFEVSTLIKLDLSNLG